MKEFLNQYTRKGAFTFKANEKLSDKCNAPKDAGGVYLVIEVKGNSIIYIGSSGWVCQNGSFQIRNGGMYDRIVNGKQFEQPRNKSWPAKMIEQEIIEIRVEWFNTFSDSMKHIPAFTEAFCIQKYFEINNCLPKWNTDF